MRKSVLNFGSLNRSVVDCATSGWHPGDQAGDQRGPTGALGVQRIPRRSGSEDSRRVGGSGFRRVIVRGVPGVVAWYRAIRIRIRIVRCRRPAKRQKINPMKQRPVFFPT